MSKIQEYTDAVINRAKYEARLCCSERCKDCSWFDECQGRVEKAVHEYLVELANVPLK
jgi:hypothetical protein